MASLTRYTCVTARCNGVPDALHLCHFPQMCGLVVREERAGRAVTISSVRDEAWQQGGNVVTNSGGNVMTNIGCDV